MTRVTRASHVCIELHESSEHQSLAGIRTTPGKICRTRGLEGTFGIAG